jgi:segregation and condensation protein B
MNAKAIAAALAALVLTAGGAVAVGGAQSTADSTDTVRDAAVDATYDDDGNVTVTVTNGGEAVENATVEVGDEEYETDANGTVTAEVEADGELEVEVDADDFSAEQEYALSDGQLTLVEEEYEYPEVEEVEEAEDDEEEEEDDEREEAEEPDEDDEDEEMDDEYEDEEESEDDDDDEEDDGDD